MKTIIYISALVLMFSCSSEQDHDHDHDHDEKDLVADLKFSDLNMEFIEPEIRSLGESIKVTGEVHAPPQSRYNVTLPYGGMVEKMNFYNGSKINKGEELAVVKHPDYIALQETYLKAYATWEEAKIAFDRQDELQKKQSTSERDYRKAVRELKSAEAGMDASEAKLKMAQISPRKVLEDGIQEEIRILSPCTGFIVSADANIGMYLNPNGSIYTLVDNDHLHIELSVYSNAFGAVRKGQRVFFTTDGDKRKYKGEITLVSSNINEENRTMNVHVHPEKGAENLMPGMFVQAEIPLSSDSALVLPFSAVMERDGRYYSVAVNSKGEAEIVEWPAHSIEHGFVKVPSDENRKFVANKLDRALAFLTGEKDAEAGHSH